MKDERDAMAAIQGVAGIRIKDRTRVGHQGVHYLSFGLCGSRSGEKGSRCWLSQAKKIRLKPIKDVTKSSNESLREILNAVVLNVENVYVECIRNRIKTSKVRSRGLRNIERSRNTFYSKLGGLNLFPERVGR